MTAVSPTNPRPRRWFRLLGHAFFSMLLLGGVAWSVTALSFHLTGGVRLAAQGAVIIAALGVIALRLRQRRQGWIAVAAAAVAVGGWYQTLTPLADRVWASDVAHGVTADISGDIVTLRNVRNFDWTSETTAIEQWETRSYDLSKIATVDMITSVWGNPDIAHLIVSFGFGDGQHVAFSVEVRREAGESFNEVGGFFRQFELVLIAADEADVIKVRTNQRGEDVRLYPINLTPDQMRTLFRSYIDQGNALARTPEFYNTVTANCTSVVYRLARVIKPDMPLDQSLLLSGRLPEYLNKMGALQGRGSMADRRTAAAISAKGLAAGDTDYSTAIRSRP